MTVTDDARTDLHQYLQATMGEARASTVMAYLPPVGWADVATKQDLTHLGDTLRLEMTAKFAEVRQEMHAGFADLRAEISNVRTEFHQALRNTVLTVVATNITLFGLAVATVRLL